MSRIRPLFVCGQGIVKVYSQIGPLNPNRVLQRLYFYNIPRPYAGNLARRLTYLRK